MKKIVALVLALVMVMGLATVATAAPAFDEEATYYFKHVSNGEWGTDGGVKMELVFVPGEADTATTGTVDHFTLGVGGSSFVVCEKKYATIEIWDGDKAGDKRVAYAKPQSAEYVNVATKVDASLYATCTTDKNLKGYLAVDATGAKTYYKDATNTDTYILVGDKMTEVTTQTVGAADSEVVFGGHAMAQYKAAALNDAETMYTFKCVVCGQKVDAVVGANKEAGVKYAPYFLTNATKTYYGNAGYDVTDVEVSNPPVARLWIVLDAPAAAGTTTETVESAKTFDAGIAMYVGMSVMAAAGSAVCLKKKD